MWFPLRPRGRLKPNNTSTPKPSHTSNAFADISRTSLLALRDSADAFPPLKSAASGVVALWDIADRAKHCKSEARAIALRAKEILEVIADAVPDPSAIPDEMLLSIQRFTDLLDHIVSSIKSIAAAGGFSRVFHLNRNEEALLRIKSQLDNAYRDFNTASTLRTEILHAQIAMEDVHIVLGLQDLSHKTDLLTTHFQIASFFGRPLMLPYKLQPQPSLFDTDSDDDKPFSQASESGDIPGLSLLNDLCMGHARCGSLIQFRFRDSGADTWVRF
ncbi:hypothetical protein B0H16DRAFT_1549078 [Mycena metata]|uniref:Uncharacterized protein n=1 Tax=Mycena metata TaxID=1033252 RepID=A0AAD7N825_9AGAR|nr:hypothetical protein B0H16DRAFT_1549078 [Mycena metata]